MGEPEMLSEYIQNLVSKDKRRIQSTRRTIEESNKDYVIITASKGTPEDEANNRQLEEEIRKKGLRPVKVEGQYRDEQGNVYKEPAYYVKGMHYSEAIPLGKKYRQESVLSRNSLVYTTGEKEGHVKLFDTSKTVFGKEAVKQTYHSEIGNKKKKTRFSAGGEYDVPMRLF